MLRSSISRHGGFRAWRIPGGTLNASSVVGKVQWHILHSHDLMEFVVDRAEVRRYWSKMIGQSIDNLSSK
jgi:hypothetical protein